MRIGWRGVAPGRRARLIFAGVAILVSAAAGLRAQDTAPAPVRKYPELWWNDVTTTVTAPGRWDGHDWLLLSLDSAAIVGTAAVLDRPIRDFTQRHTGAAWEKAVNHFEPLGSVWSFAVIGGFYLDGRIEGDARAENTAVDALSASIVAAGIITPVLKEIAGRSRPRAHEGTYHFRPFGGGQSFPSGHATQAFAIASVIAAHYDNLWVDGAAYGVAGLVGVARLDHNAHFTSDVLAGAIIGTTVGREMVRLNEGKRLEWAGKPVTLAPWIMPGGEGLEVGVAF